MKPYERRNKFRYNYKNYSLKKGWVNWWEYELSPDRSKKAVRREAREQIRKELMEKN